jgi:hypothetical protein
LLRLREIANAAELTYLQQEQVIREVKARLVDVDIEERRSLAKILERFRDRHDIAVTVAQEIDGVLKNLVLSPELTPPSTLKSWNVQPRQAIKAFLDRLPNRDQKAPTLRLPAAQLNLLKMADSIKDWYIGQDLEVQGWREGSRMIIQCRSPASQRWMAAGMSLSVILWMEGDQLAVQIGVAKWKEAVRAVAAIVPLIAYGSAVGAWRQLKLYQATVEYIKAEIPNYVENVPPTNEGGPTPSY